MAELAQRFRDFLTNIRLSDSQKEDIITAHRTLRRRLKNDSDLAYIFVETFLQGSYRRSTIVKPKLGKRSDVDVVVVTRIPRSTDPSDAMALFAPFLDKYYRGKWKYQGRSIGISLSYAEMDLVITSAPSEETQEAMRSAAALTEKGIEDLDDWRFNALWLDPDNRQSVGAESRMFKAASSDEWKIEALWIPDRDAEEWQETNPLEQIRWTFDKNKRTNTHFVNVVKAIKWWRRVHHPEDRPKGYPLEHMVGDSCPDGITSVATGVTRALEEIVSKYEIEVLLGRTPRLQDRGTSQNVMARITPEEFATFHCQAREAAAIAREALDSSDPESTEKWQELFGNEFPDPPKQGKSSNGGGGRGLGFYSERRDSSDPRRGRFASR